MSLFDATNQKRTAFLNPAPSAPASMLESMRSAYDVTAGTGRSTSFHELEYDQFESYRDQIHDLTGDRLYNPLDTTNASFNAEAPGGAEFAIEDWFKDVAKLRDKYPGLPEITHNTLMDDISRRRAELRKQRESVAKREHTLGNVLATFIGGAGAILSDPIIAGSMVFGAPIASGVIRAAAVEAGIGIASEVPVQGLVQTQRVALGEGIDVQEAAANILLAGAGGAGAVIGLRSLVAGLRGAGTGFKRVLALADKLPPEAKDASVRASQNYLKRLDEIQSQSPYGQTTKAVNEHMRRFDEALKRVNGAGNKVQLTSTTAIGRFVDDFAPRSTVEPVIHKRGEPVDQYLGRLRGENPELFKKFDQIEADITTVETRIATIERGTGTPATDNARLAEQLVDLQQRRADLLGGPRVDKRKIKRIDRKIEQIEKQGNVTRAAANEARKATRLSNQKTKLNAKLKDLKKQKRDIDKTVARVIRSTEPLSSEQTAFTVRNTIRQIPEFDRELTEGVVQLGENLAVRVPNDARLRRRTTPRQPVEPLSDNAVKELEKTAKDPQQVDEALRAQVEDDPDSLIEFMDENGNFRTASMREIVEELDEEKRLYDEFADCITRST